MNIYVIRHGQTDWNKEKIMLSTTDIELNKVGIKQAEEATKIVDKLAYDLVISSPLLRTRETTEIINRNNLKPVFYDNRIVERNAGDLEKKSTNDIIFKDYWNYYLNLEYKNAENIKDFFLRVYDFIDEIKIKYKDKNLLIVTHNGVCRAIRTYFEGIVNKGNLKEIGQDNCEIRMYKI